MEEFTELLRRQRENAPQHFENSSSTRDLVREIPVNAEYIKIPADAIQSEQVKRALEILEQNKRKAQKVISRPGYEIEFVWKSSRSITSHEFAIRKSESLQEYIEERERYPSIYAKFV